MGCSRHVSFRHWLSLGVLKSRVGPSGGGPLQDGLGPARHAAVVVRRRQVAACALLLTPLVLGCEEERERPESTRLEEREGLTQSVDPFDASVAEGATDASASRSDAAVPGHDSGLRKPDASLDAGAPQVMVDAAEAHPLISIGDAEALMVGQDGSAAAPEPSTPVTPPSAPECGDGMVNRVQEQCDGDDFESRSCVELGYAAGSLHCSALCTVDASACVPFAEQEPNDLATQANPLIEPFYGRIEPAGDVDSLSFTTEADSDRLVLTVLAPDGNACADGLVDSTVEILTMDGQLLGRNDDGGEGQCSALTLTALPAGSYIAVVRGGSTSAQFSYELTLARALCGDGVLGYGEQCDDANTETGDGCDSSCRGE